MIINHMICHDKTNMGDNKISGTSVVDGELENEHVTSRQTGDWVGYPRKDSYVGIIIIVFVSPCFGSCIYELYWFCMEVNCC